jgi:hypothetical protein
MFTRAAFLVLFSAILCASTSLAQNIIQKHTFDRFDDKRISVVRPLDIACKEWYILGFDLNREQRYSDALDTLRAFIYSCHTPWKSPGFSEMNHSMQYISKDNSRWLTYREWVKTVLYLNQIDQEYYCDAAQAILTSFQYNQGPRGMDYNGAISIIDYLLNSGKCIDDSTFLWNTRSSLRYRQILAYNDTVQSAVESPIDTGNVSLFDLDLQILLGPENAVADSKSSTDFRFSLSPNPAGLRSELHLSTDIATTVTIELYDVLGKKVLDLERHLIGKGESQIPMDVSQLEAGSYYLRLATSLGDIRSIRLVKP